MNVTTGQICETLENLGCEVSNVNSEKFEVTVPTFRPDLIREIDLIEEVSRIVGFDNIPEKLFKDVIAHDHAIIYYEAYNISQKIGVIPNAIWHIDPDSLWCLAKKNYKYGQTSLNLSKNLRYKTLIKKKIRFRKGALKHWRFGLQSYLLLMLKGAGYYSGYFSEKLRISVMKN